MHHSNLLLPTFASHLLPPTSCARMSIFCSCYLLDTFYFLPLLLVVAASVGGDGNGQDGERGSRQTGRHCGETCKCVDTCAVATSSSPCTGVAAGELARRFRAVRGVWSPTYPPVSTQPAVSLEIPISVPPSHSPLPSSAPSPGSSRYKPGYGSSHSFEDAGDAPSDTPSDPSEEALRTSALLN